MPAQRRRARRMAVLVAASLGVSLIPRSSPGQTWIDPTSGSWSVGANWLGGVAPVSSASTQLTFSSAGAQSYTAFNDIADPFTLNTLNLNNAGTAGFTVSGQTLLFAGAGRAINL